MLKKPTIIRLQEVVKQVRTRAPEDAPELHQSLVRLEEKVKRRIAAPLPAHPAVKLKPGGVSMEMRRLRWAASGKFKLQRRRGRPVTTAFDINAMTRSVKKLNYYLSLPGQDEPDVP